MCTHLSKLPEAKNLPSGLKATEYTGSLWRVNVCRQSPRSTSHSLTVESKEAEAKTSLALGLGVPGPVQDHLIV